MTEDTKVIKQAIQSLWKHNAHHTEMTYTIRMSLRILNEALDASEFMPEQDFATQYRNAIRMANQLIEKEQ
ncbi:hypothetical protein UFOVP221_25 [uncultured Caudovirales phage]|uniref:Uncharacterized protein n=1 Tax=uncultured Caudovirales phage TaxID=2100421 RepID=A0A6J7WQK6_9CAUD|nr:hypothetical protein UFOVP221_25 [uncultured Caudovirales phage]